MNDMESMIHHFKQVMEGPRPPIGETEPEAEPEVAVRFGAEPEVVAGVEAEAVEAWAAICW